MPVIVTRPQPEALRWVERLRAAQVDAVALPLIAIDPVPDSSALLDAWRQLADYRAVMFVSGNAVRHFFAASPGTAFAPRAWAPGPGTADALHECGVPQAQVDSPAADAGQFDSEALWQVVAGQVHRGDRVLLVRGQPGGREWLAERIEAAGAQVDTVASYVRQAPVWSPRERALAATAAADRSTWLISSSEAVGHLRELLPGQDWGNARAIATHPRIAQAARHAGFGDVRECRPAFDEVLASLQSAR